MICYWLTLLQYSDSFTLATTIPHSQANTQLSITHESMGTRLGGSLGTRLGGSLGTRLGGSLGTRLGGSLGTRLGRIRLESKHI